MDIGGVLTVDVQTGGRRWGVGPARSPDDRGMLAVAQSQTPPSDRKTLTLGIDTEPPRVTGLGIRSILIGI